MSTVRKEGVIAHMDAFATMDYFVGKTVVNVKLATEQGAVLDGRFIPSRGFRMDFFAYAKALDIPIENIVQDGRVVAVKANRYASGAEILAYDPYAQAFEKGKCEPLKPEVLYDSWDVRFNPAVGDTVSLEWDYENFNGVIMALAENRKPIEPPNMPVLTKSQVNKRALMESFDPAGDGTGNSLEDMLSVNAALQVIEDDDAQD